MMDRISNIAPVLRAAEKSETLQAKEDMYTGSLRYQIPNNEWDIAIETDIQGSYFLIEEFAMIIDGKRYDLLSLHVSNQEEL